MVSLTLRSSLPAFLLALSSSIAMGCSSPDSEGEPASPGDPSIEPSALAECEAVDERAVFVMNKIIFSRIESNGITRGFDLDGYMTDSENTAQGCGQVDYRDVDGNVGIDNQFGKLLPLIEAAGGEAFEPYIQGSINDGGLLLMLELEDVQSLRDDPCVHIRFLSASGVPIVGADDQLESRQTFDRALDRGFHRTEKLQIEEGVFELHSFVFSIPFFIFDFAFEVEVREAAMQATFQEDGSIRGTLAGSVRVENMLEIANQIPGGEQFPELINTVGTRFADLEEDEDGVCQALSVGLEFEAVPAFFYADSEEVDPESGQ
jgi:hypothetical protein